MKCAISFCTLFISLCFCVCQGALKTHYIEELCYRKYTKEAFLSLKSGQSGILMSVPSESSTTDCTIKLRPEYGSSVVLSIYKYSIADEDQLTIEDSHGFKVALLGQAEILDESKTFTSDGTLTIRYIRDSNSTLERNSRVKFQFVFTQFHDYPCSDFNEFQCKNQRCIRKDLVCDRHNHCGDNSDQENCGPRDDLQTLSVPEPKANVWMISIFVCSALLGIVVFVFIAVLIRGAIKKKTQKEGTVVVPTVATEVPQSPSAPEMPSSFAVRIRQSFRRPSPKSNAQTTSTQSAPEEPKSEKYEVPAMYPEIPSLPNQPGVDNPVFKPDN